MAISTVCKVCATGIGADGNTNLSLDDVPGSTVLNGAKWFRARAGREREMLATALMAMSAGYYVWVELDQINTVPTGNIAGNINAMYARSTP